MTKDDSFGFDRLSGKPQRSFVNMKFAYLIIAFMHFTFAVMNGLFF